MAGGVVVAAAGGQPKIKGGRWTVARFFLVSTAYTSVWLAVSSELGYYKNLHGPQVLLQVCRGVWVCGEGRCRGGCCSNTPGRASAPWQHDARVARPSLTLCAPHHPHPPTRSSTLPTFFPPSRCWWCLRFWIALSSGGWVRQ